MISPRPSLQYPSDSSHKPMRPTPTTVNADSNVVQCAVETLLRRIDEALGAAAPNFMAVHFACGIPGDPGYILRSAARARNCPLAEWASTIPLRDRGDLHRRVIIRHVREFHRSETFLSFLSQLSAKIDKKLLDIESTTEMEALQIEEEPLDFEFTTDSKALALDVNLDRNARPARLRIAMNDSLALKLSPPDLTNTYLKGLYTGESGNTNTPQVDVLKSIHLPRSEAFGLLKRSDLELIWPGLSSFRWDLRNSLDVWLWRLLGPLQSILLYAAAGKPNGDDGPDTTAGIGGFGWAYPLTPIQRSPDTPIQPWCYIFGTPLLSGDKPGNIEDLVFRELCGASVYEHLRQARNDGDHCDLREALLNEIRHDCYPTDDNNYLRDLAVILDSQIKDLVVLDGQRQRLSRLIWWMCCLATKLRGAKHEGKPSDFWFVAGERTEFVDDPDVILDKRLLPVAGDPRINVASDFRPIVEKGRLHRDRTKLSVKRLEKEHYPWFTMGRHALFFDISDDYLSPCGLAELRIGSWHRLVTESDKLPIEQHLDIPACAMVFTDGNTGEAGVILCRRVDGGRARIERFLRFRHGKWQLAADDRQEVLAKVITEATKLPGGGSDYTVNEVIQISQIALMVADNPQAGGTLVFVDDSATSQGFLKLGLAWEFGRRDQYQLPLISHDGATVLWKEDEVPQWAYRKMLLPDSEAGGLLPALEALSLGDDPQFPLAGVGTRRWSAALSALRIGVRLVVSISTDGDMTCWSQEKLSADIPNREDAKQGETWLCYRHLPVGTASGIDAIVPVLKVKNKEVAE